MMITLKNHGVQGLLLRGAWGPRRITSNKRYGVLDSAYPPAVTAGHKLWVMWLRQGLLDWVLWRWTIVVPKSKAKARIAIQISDLDNPPAALVPNLDIEALQFQRDDHRRAGRFAEADEIRDQLISCGVIVADTGILR